MTTSSRDVAAGAVAAADRDADARGRLVSIYVGLLIVPLLAAAWIWWRGEWPEPAKQVYDALTQLTRQQEQVDAKVEQSIQTQELARRRLAEGEAKAAVLGSDVARLGRQVEEASERVTQVDQKYDQRVGQVDQKATAAAQSAAEALAAARAASASRSPSIQPMAADLVFEEALPEFPVSPAGPPAEVRRSLDRLVAQLRQQSNAVHLEIVALPAAASDPRAVGIAAERAAAIQDYLYSAHAIPLHRIQTLVSRTWKNGVPGRVMLRVRSSEP